MFKLLEKLKGSFLPNGATLVIVCLSFILGWQLGHRDYNFKIANYKADFKVENRQPPPNSSLDFKLFWEVWEMLSKQYIDKTALDPQKLYYGAIQGMVAAIGDPYTVFLPPQAQKATKEQLGGSFEGVGMQLGYNKEKRLVVIAALKDTPAEKGGIKSGDMILKINDKDSINFSLPEAVSLIRGPKGTEVTLNIFREGENKPLDVTLKRDTIVVKSVEIETKTTDQSDSKSDTADESKQKDDIKKTKSGKIISYIRLSSFGERTRTEWDEAVSNALASASQGVIIDVRNNPGGFLDAAVYIASEFLSSGDIVLQEDGLGNKRSMTVTRPGKMLKMPLVIMINKGSASASEILAGAMQDRDRAKVVGEQSFGKGTIQSSEDLPESTGIHITTAKWLTPNGRWIHNIGITPDIKVEKGEEGQDAQLEKALEVFE